MITSELKDLFRLDVADPEEPGAGDDSESLWLDSEIYGYIDAAQKKFARRTDIFLDATTASITELAVVANNPFVTFDPRITKVRRATLASTGRKLSTKNLHQMDGGGGFYNDYGINCNSDWESATGTPRFLVTDVDSGQARLAPIPTANDTVKLTVYRLPLESITSASDALEVTDEEHQRFLLMHMKHLAYSKQDTDVYDPALSERFFQEFMVETAKVKRQLRRGRFTAGTVQYGGY